MYMDGRVHAGVGVHVASCGQTWAESIKYDARNRMTFDENTVDIAELLATSAQNRGWDQ